MGEIFLSILRSVFNASMIILCIMFIIDYRRDEKRFNEMLINSIEDIKKQIGGEK